MWSEGLYAKASCVLLVRRTAHVWGIGKAVPIYRDHFPAHALEQKYEVSWAATKIAVVATVSQDRGGLPTIIWASHTPHTVLGSRQGSICELR